MALPPVHFQISWSRSADYELRHVPVSKLRAWWPEQMSPERIERQVKYPRDHGRPPSPIWVTIDDRGVFHITDGRHRAEAARRLGRKTIPAFVWCDDPALLGKMRRARRW